MTLNQHNILPLSNQGPDWYDYGARFYDPQIGRWHVVDPKATETFSEVVKEGRISN